VRGADRYSFITFTARWRCCSLSTFTLLHFRSDIARKARDAAS
jgi:hypothetical protein